MRCAVLLSGCGVRDGSEIHESVLALLALDERGHEYICCAPDIRQAAVVDHRTGRVQKEARSVLSESARIARGKIVDIREVDMSAVDAVLLPGGFGAATNLCDFGSRGADCVVEPNTELFLRRAHEAGKALGFMCIAPVIAAKLFGGDGVRVTVGSDLDTASAIEGMGAHHERCRVDEACVDETLRVVTTPAYMLAESVTECLSSARALVAALEKLV